MCRFTARKTRNPAARSLHQDHQVKENTQASGLRSSIGLITVVTGSSLLATVNAGGCPGCGRIVGTRLLKGGFRAVHHRLAATAGSLKMDSSVLSSSTHLKLWICWIRSIPAIPRHATGNFESAEKTLRTYEVKRARSTSGPVRHARSMPSEASAPPAPLEPRGLRAPSGQPAHQVRRACPGRVRPWPRSSDTRRPWDRPPPRTWGISQDRRLQSVV